MPIKNYFLGKLRAAVGTAAIDEKITFLEKNAHEIRRLSKEIKQTTIPAEQQGQVPQAFSSIEYDQVRMDELSKKCLFVVGNVRSGTTILMRSFNRSPDIHMTMEAHYYEHEHWTDFAENFNKQNADLNHSPGKSFFVPPLSTGPVCALDYLEWMSRHYRYVGDKIAIGYRRPVKGRSQEKACFIYQAQHFFFSKYFLIVRHPYETVLSCEKMWPTIPRRELIKCWLRSLDMCLDIMNAFPNSWLIFHDCFNEDTISKISEIIGVDIPPAEGIIGKNKQKTVVDPKKVPDELKNVEAFMISCGEVYEQVKSIFSTDSLKCTVPFYQHAFVGTKQKIGKLLKQPIEYVDV